LGQKAGGHIETVLAKPVAQKEVAQSNASKEGKSDDQKVVGLSLKALKLKAGETLPGGRKSPLHLAQGTLGQQLSKKTPWYERRKLGIDRSQFWGGV